MSMANKPHLQRAFGAWYATLGVDGALGVTPLEAYQKLIAHLEEVNRRAYCALLFGLDPRREH